MKCSFISAIVQLTFLGLLHASSAKSQDLSQKVKLQLRQASVKECFNNIQMQSNVKFLYTEELMNRVSKKVNLSVSQITVTDAMTDILASTNLIYRLVDGYVVIEAKPVQQVPGKIYGKVVDDKGEALPGASIKIIELNRSVSAAVDGSYNFSVPAGTYTLEVSYISYQSKRITEVSIKSGALTQLNIVLTGSSSALKTVTIQSSFKKEAVAGLYAQQKNAASVTDGISAEQIARTPDNNIGQVMKRISGISTVDNRYVVVRGLTERYNQGMIDGIVLPSTDMNRHNFSFDVIPVEMVSNVVVNKTATPDVSAEFAGGQVSVNTLDIPLENFTIISLGTGFNSNTLGKEFLQAGKRGKYDFLGFDDGHRKMPEGIRSWGIGEPIPDYAVPQSQQLSADVFKIYSSTGGLNQNYRLSAGRVYNLKHDQKWGFVAGLSLRNIQETNEFIDVRPLDFLYDQHFISPTSLPVAYIDSTKVRREGYLYKYNTTAGAQFNLGIQGKTYRFGIKNIFSQILNNSFNTTTGADPETSSSNAPIRIQRGIQTPEFTRILQNKLEGENTLTAGGLKLTWLAARTYVRQEVRDRTKFSYRLTIKEGGVEYYQDPLVANPNISTPIYDYRIFTDTRETDYNWAANLSQPFNFLGDKSMVKAGYNGIYKRRDLSATTLNIRTEDRAFNNFNRPYEEVMAPENMGIGTGQAYYLADANSGSQFDGKANFHAGYLMLDQRFLNKIRIVYGVRAENYEIKNTQAEYLSQGTNKEITGEKNTNYLPSANLTYNITPKMNFRASFSKTIIRPDFRETSYFGNYDVPLDAIIAGGDLVSTKIKNTDLRYEWYPSAGEIISVSGFYKSFDKPIELIVGQDASGFVSEYRYQNQKSAVNYGIEMEFRKSLGFISPEQWLQNISLFGNGTLIKSKVNTLTYTGINHTTVIENEETRALFGQSPYVVNAGISYTSPDYGMTISYNRSGRRTYTIASSPGFTEYENGRDQADLQLFCRLFQKKMELKLNIGNILNSETFYYINSNGYYSNKDEIGNNSYTPAFGKDSYEKDYDDVRYRIKNGVSSSLSLTYKF